MEHPTEQLTLAEAQARGAEGADAAESRLNDTQIDELRESTRRYLQRHEFCHVDRLWDWFERDRPGLHPGKYVGPTMKWAQAEGLMVKWAPALRAGLEGASMALPSVRSNGAPKWVYVSQVYDGSLS